MAVSVAANGVSRSALVDLRGQHQNCICSRPSPPPPVSNSQRQFMGRARLSNSQNGSSEMQWKTRYCNIYLFTPHPPLPNIFAKGCQCEMQYLPLSKLASMMWKRGTVRDKRSMCIAANTKKTKKPIIITGALSPAATSRE